MHCFEYLKQLRKALQFFSQIAAYYHNITHSGKYIQLNRSSKEQKNFQQKYRNMIHGDQNIINSKLPIQFATQQ